jgi:hypothetical protein
MAGERGLELGAPLGKLLVQRAQLLVHLVELLGRVEQSQVGLGEIAIRLPAGGLELNITGPAIAQDAVDRLAIPELEHTRLQLALVLQPTTDPARDAATTARLARVDLAAGEGVASARDGGTRIVMVRGKLRDACSPTP